MKLNTKTKTASYYYQVGCSKPFTYSRKQVLSNNVSFKDNSLDPFLTNSLLKFEEGFTIEIFMASSLDSGTRWSLRASLCYIALELEPRLYRFKKSWADNNFPSTLHAHSCRIGTNHVFLYDKDSCLWESFDVAIFDQYLMLLASRNTIGSWVQLSREKKGWPQMLHYYGPINGVVGLDNMPNANPHCRVKYLNESINLFVFYACFVTQAHFTPELSAWHLECCTGAYNG